MNNTMKVYSNQFPVYKPQPKKANKHALFAGNNIVPDTEGQSYGFLVAKMQEMKANGIRFLKIKAVK